MTTEIATRVGLALPAVNRIASATTTSFDDWRAVVELVGDFDLATSDVLRGEIHRHLAAGRRVLRVDTAGVTFFDSIAVGVLVEAHWRCVADRGTMIIASAPPILRRLLEVTGLDRVLLVDAS